MCEDNLRVDSDFDYLLSFLPEGWESKARELGALRRCRKIPDPQTMLRILLIHLAEGCSLRETAVHARKGGLADVSDVAIMDRLRMSHEWFRWMNMAIMKSWIPITPESVYGISRSIYLVDGTVVNEPGPTGSSWRLHYCIGLPGLACREIRLCAVKGGEGESFCRFEIEPGSLFIGDRAYGVPPGIRYVHTAGGHVLARFAHTNLPLQNPDGGVFDLLEHLRSLRPKQLGDWPVIVAGKNMLVPGRVCAIKKTRQAIEQAIDRVKRKAQKNCTQLRPETTETAAYIFVFTTLSEAELSTARVLEMYRGRWQIELVFKRLKSIIRLGHLRKIDPDSSKAWIQGKLFVALMIEALRRHAESFSPWGYPLFQDEPITRKPLA